MIHGILIKTTGEIEAFDYDPRNSASLAQLQEAVGGFIESAPTRARELTLYCNEEGKIHKLAKNQLATELLFESAFDYIAGDAVVVGAPDGEGYDTTIPEALERLIRSLGRIVAVG